jgi:hypothetical protein
MTDLKSRHQRLGWTPEREAHCLDDRPAKQTPGLDPREGIVDYGNEMKDMKESRQQPLDSV